MNRSALINFFNFIIVGLATLHTTNRVGLYYGCTATKFPKFPIQASQNPLSLFMLFLHTPPSQQQQQQQRYRQMKVLLLTGKSVWLAGSLAHTMPIRLSSTFYRGALEEPPDKHYLVMADTRVISSTWRRDTTVANAKPRHQRMLRVPPTHPSDLYYTPLQIRRPKIVHQPERFHPLMGMGTPVSQPATHFSPFLLAFCLPLHASKLSAFPFHFISAPCQGDSRAAAAAAATLERQRVCPRIFFTSLSFISLSPQGVGVRTCSSTPSQEIFKQNEWESLIDSRRVFRIKFSQTKLQLPTVI